LVGYCETKRRIGKTGCRWDDIETDLKEIACEVWDGINMLRIGISGEFISRRFHEI
jgi:hypothetical protein